MNSDDDIAERCALAVVLSGPSPASSPVRQSSTHHHHLRAAGAGTWSSTRIYAPCSVRPASRATTGCSSSSASPSRACDTACATTSEPRASPSLNMPRWPATNPPALASSLLTRSPGAACGTAGTTRHRARATGTSETTTCSARTHAAPHSTRNCTTLIRVGTSASRNRRATVRVQHAGVHWCHVLNCLL